MSRLGMCLALLTCASLFLNSFAVVSLVSAEENCESWSVCADYYRLRVGGLILAAVLCLIGITILFSKMRRTGSNAQQMLNDQGSRHSPSSNPI
uniref:FXYD domain-containing ion transport regulator n=1 Tax=Scophthalmus maximus TaxID=52904 RepID=A0A8D3A2F6_SCOMX